MQLSASLTEERELQNLALRCGSAFEDSGSWNPKRVSWQKHQGASDGRRLWSQEGQGKACCFRFSHTFMGVFSRLRTTKPTLDGGPKDRAPRKQEVLGRGVGAWENASMMLSELLGSSMSHVHVDRPLARSRKDCGWLVQALLQRALHTL